MNSDQTNGNHEQIKGKIKEIWGLLSDDDVAALYNGQQERFFDKLEEKYGLIREEVESKLKEFEKDGDGDYLDKDHAA